MKTVTSIVLLALALGCGKYGPPQRIVSPAPAASVPADPIPAADAESIEGVTAEPDEDFDAGAEETTP